MAFFAYRESDGPIENGDSPSGLLSNTSKVLIKKPAPFAVVEDHDAIIEIAYAHLGRNPDDAVYVTNSEGVILRRLICEQYQRDRRGEWEPFAWVMLFFVFRPSF